MKNTYFLLNDDNPVIVGGEEAAASAQPANSEVGTAAQTPVAGAQPPIDGGLNLVGMIIMWVALFGALYFFMIRPQRKREKQMQEMQSSIGVGDNVLTSSGLYGKVTDVGEDCFVIEFGTNRGVRVPVRKSDVLGIKTPNINPAPREIASSDK